MSRSVRNDENTMLLRLRLADGLLQVSFEGGQAGTRTRATGELPYQQLRTEQLATQIVRALREAPGGSAVVSQQTVRQCGLELFGLLVPSSVKPELVAPAAAVNDNDAPPMLLRLSLDPAIDFIPCEWLHDGEAFLCERFAIGRVLLEDSHSSLRPNRQGSRRLLILSDPQGNLPAARMEGPLIKSAYVLDRGWEIRLKNRSTTVAEARTMLAACDVFHFAGHSHFDPREPSAGGLRFSDGTLTAGDIARLAGSASMPRLVVANSCESGIGGKLPEPGLEPVSPASPGATTAGLAVGGLAQAFLNAGVELFVGNLGKPLDEESAQFGRRLHRLLLEGATIGEAVYRARQVAAHGRGLDRGISMLAAFVLHGDPAARLTLSESAGRGSVAASAAPRQPPTGRFRPTACGSCGRLIEHDYGVGGQCQAPGCHQPICRRCRRERQNQCRMHATGAAPVIMREERGMTAPAGSATASSTLPAPTVAECLVIDGFFERLRQSVSRTETIADPKSGKTTRLKPSLLWDWQSRTGVSAEDPVRAVLHRYPQIARAACYALRGYDLIDGERFRPECRLLAIFWRPGDAGLQPHKPGLSDLSLLLDEMKAVFEAQDVGCLLMLASPAGWDESLISIVNGRESRSCKWMHPLLPLILHDAGSVVSLFDQRDLRLQPLGDLFDLETFEERVDRAHEFAVAALAMKSHVSAAQVAAEMAIPQVCAEAALRLLACETGVRVRVVESLGLVAQRHEEQSS